MVRVKSALGTGRMYPKPSCSCPNWLYHWEVNKSVKLAAWCRCCGKNVPHNRLNGGHVQKVPVNSASIYYIVPLCDECNAKDGIEFEVREADMILANGRYCRLKK